MIGDELERLAANRDYWYGACQQAWAERDAAVYTAGMNEAQVLELEAKIKELEVLNTDLRKDVATMRFAWQKALKDYEDVLLVEKLSKA
jgi:acetate kinase